MNRRELEHLVALGEDSRRQFKEDVRNADSLPRAYCRTVVWERVSAAP